MWQVRLILEVLAAVSRLTYKSANQDFGEHDRTTVVEANLKADESSYAPR